MGRISTGWEGREGRLRTRDSLSMEVEDSKRELRGRLELLGKRWWGTMKDLGAESGHEVYPRGAAEGGSSPQ